MQEIEDGGSVMTEAQMRDAKAPTPGSVEELAEYVRGLVERPHDYGTCVYAMSMAAVAAFNFVAGRLGVTGFQASCADLDILARTRGWKWGKLLDYEKLLYPQFRGEFPGWDDLLEEHRDELAKRAAVKLADAAKDGLAAESVTRHWCDLVANGPSDTAGIAQVVLAKLAEEK